MVGIATISDLVPLKNENRLFAKYGLLVLKKSKRPGLQKILANSKINQKKINEDDIAFSIAPRINSASRMADPVHAFYALLDNEEAVKYAEELEKYNTRRKEEIKIANSSIDYQKFKNKKIILIGDEKWSPGIIGLIASKVSEETGKITFVWGMGEDTKILKGSVRGIEDGESVVEIMTKAKNILENFGGHEAAGGFSLKKNNLIEFEKFLDNYILKIDNDKKNIKEVENYINIKTSEINKNIFDEIKIFSPFGVGNEKIIFKVNVNNLKIKRFGKELSHLEIFFDGVRGVEFFANEKIEEEIKIKKEFLVNLEWDNFRENVMLRLVK
jgi:single-stranded-DNA-specific exonuclease